MKKENKILPLLAVFFALTLFITPFAFAQDYPYDATFKNLIYSAKILKVTGTVTLKDGRQTSSEGTKTLAKYSMVSRGSEPAKDTVITFFTVTGEHTSTNNNLIQRSFGSFNSYAYLRIDNQNPSHWYGKNPITASGKLTGSLTY